MEDDKTLKNLNSKHPATRHLAIVLVTTSSMLKWCVDFFGNTQDLPEDERFQLFKNALNVPKRWGMNLEGVEWDKLYEFCKDPFRKEEQVEKSFDKNDEQIKRYCDAIKSFLAELIKEPMALDSLDRSGSKPTSKEWVQIYQARAELAANRLSELRKLNPPDIIKNVHSTYLDAFSVGLKARQEEASGNFFKASAAYQISSDLLRRAEKLLKDMGIEY